MDLSKKMHLYLSPEKEKKKYGIQILQTSPKDKPFDLHFTLDVVLTDPDHPQGCLYEIKRNTAYLNHKTIRFTIEELSEKIALSFYPLQLLVNKQGTISRIVNLQAVRLRWEQQKQKLAAYYQGEIAAFMLEKASAALQNEQTFLFYLYGSWEISLLFRSLYRDYTLDDPTPVIWHFPLFGGRSRTKTEVQLTRIEKTDSQKTICTFSGIFSDPSGTSGKAVIHYCFHNTHNTVFYAIAQFNWEDAAKNPQQKTISVFETESRKNKVLITKTETQKTKKRGFLGTIAYYLSDN